MVNFAAALHQLQDPKIDYGQLLRQRHFHDDYTYTIPGTSAIRGTVSQDSFHSLEVVSGTANLHLALSWGPYATTADLDLYLYDPAGNLKAKSDGMNLDGLFGAAESIDLREPDA